MSSPACSPLIFAIPINAKRAKTLPKKRADRRKRSLERDNLTSEYYNKLEGFLKKSLKHSEVRIAETYAESQSFRAEELAKELEERVEKSGKAKEACGFEMETALAEMRRAYTLRDRMIEEQKGLVRLVSDKKNDKKVHIYITLPVSAKRNI